MRSLDGCRLHLKLPTTSDSTRTERRSRTPLPPPGSRRHCPLHRPTAMGDNSAADAPAPGRFGRICVFCGSNPGNRAVFGDAALDLGKELVMRRPMARQRPHAPPPLPPTPPAASEFRYLARFLCLLPFSLTLAVAGFCGFFSLCRWRGGSIWSTVAAASGSWA